MEMKKHSNFFKNMLIIFIFLYPCIQAFKTINPGDLEEKYNKQTFLKDFKMACNRAQ